MAPKLVLNWRQVFSRYRIYLSLQLFVVLGVILAFRWVVDVKTASMFAASFFVVGSAGPLIYEFRFGDGIRSWSFWVCLLMLLVFTLPVLIMRLAFWNTAFSELSWWGLSSAQWHQYSRIGFLIQLCGFFVDSLRLKKKQLPPNDVN